ncbi:DUF397 domain-containing protein [Nocardiopsis trehalosi]|uniref:DUF397 domain-containing protein n=1 Tax=Nocardiopsis trehalosi TaxID=109329 RepID=UPI0009FD8004|nr:DUF397 domain-containing protein [Nocardiopsis trehalosi]
MSDVSLSAPNWRTSSYTHSADCVEFALHDRRTLMRDSKNRSGPVLCFSETEWAGFVALVNSRV